MDRLRETSPIFISLVAKTGNQVVGHILFTAVRIKQKLKEDVIGMGLAPLSVLPQFQGQEIGMALCYAGLTRVEAEGYPFAVVIGHPGYYPKFEFEPARRFGLKTTYKDIPDDIFMVRVFTPDVLMNVTGVIYYRPEFNEIT